MCSAKVTRTERAGTVTFAETVGGTDAATLVIRTSTREVVNVETRRAFQRQGLASMLWAAANAEGECFHSLEHHRTPEGDFFAYAVGGESIDAETGYVAVCSICTDDIDEED